MHSQTVEWVRQTGGLDLDQSTSIKYDSQGNVFVAGSFRGTVSFDPNSNNYDFTATEYGDAYLQKFDAQGNFLWAQVFASPEIVEFPRMVIDSDDNIYFTNRFQGSIDLDPGPGTDIHTTPDTGYSNSYIVKLDNDGQYVWGHSFEHVSPAQYVTILGIAIKNDELFLTGNFQDTIDVDFGSDQYLLSGVGADGFFMKIDTNGTFIWAHMLGGSGKNITPSKVIFDNENNIIIGGHFNGHDLDFDWGPNEDIHTTNDINNSDVFILKVSPDGVFQWAISAVGCAPNLLGICNDDLRSMDTDINNDIYFTGAYDYFINFEPDTSDFILDTGVEPCTVSPCFAHSKAYIAKISSQGEMIWAKDFDGDNQTVGLASSQEIWNLVRRNEHGQLFFILSVYGTINIDVNGNTISHTGTDDHTFMTFLNVNPQNGSITNAFFISSTLNITVYDMEATNSRLYVSGRFWDEVYFDSTHPLTPLGVDGYTLLIKDDLMGVRNFFVPNLVTLFPNPAKDYVILKTDHNKSIQKVIFRDVFGRIIKKIELQADAYTDNPQVDVSNLSSGCYFVEVFTEDSKPLTYKLLKK
jgi:hypothetical protein